MKPGTTTVMGYADKNSFAALEEEFKGQGFETTLKKETKNGLVHYTFRKGQ